MNKYYSFWLLFFFIAPVMLFGQTGRITGVVKDAGSNASLSGVSVAVVGGAQATSTDFEGAYSFDLPTGTYTLLFSYVGYVSQEITTIKVDGGKAASVDVTLSSSFDELDEVVVSVSARKNTEQSILNMQKNSGVVMDGLSSQAIKRSGASDIASAVKIVPGVSIQEGKYVYVRGLGDRYTKSILNGMDLPGLDPDKNTVQMDIFPTGVLENIIVMKSASADLPADFTGGVVDIVTKDIPTQKQMGISLSLGYNPDMHFKDNYVGYKGSGTDFLGYDKGKRSMPVTKDYNIPSPVLESNRPAVEYVTRSFDPTMGAERKKNNSPDMSLSFDFSNQYNVGGNKLGVIGVLNYKKETRFYEGFRNGIYQKPNQTDESSELRADRTTMGDLGEEEVLLSGMLGLNYKTDRSKYTFNALHIQNGESSAAIYDQVTRIQNSNTTYKHTLDYSQRSITNLMLGGKHSNENADFITEWKISPSWAKVKDKDVRQTTFVREGDKFVMNTDAGLPMRIWRNLDEVNAVAKVDFTKKWNLFERDASLKFGGLYSYKQRDYGIHNYTINFRENDTGAPNGDPNKILNEENIYSANADQGFYIQGEYEAANTFDAKQHTAAAYASVELKPWEQVKAIIGVRAEQYTSFFTGQNVARDVYDNVKTIDDLDFFPSLNLIYTPINNHNLRASYSRTVARPSFKELSVVQIYDPLTDTRFLGNLDLKSTYINNADIRYEIFADRAQMFAVSGFYKNFKDPIELQSYSDAAPTNITARNTPSANVYGVEVEGRKHFGFISEGLQDLSFNLNVTVVKSEIEMSDNEFNARKSFARPGEEIENKRDLQGQSPYLINTGLMYNSSEKGFEAGMFYNVQGKTLEIIGFSKNSDVFAKPFHSLNLNLAKKLGANFRAGTVSVKVDNLLDSKRQSVYESFGAADQIYSERLYGRRFTVGYSFNF